MVKVIKAFKVDPMLWKEVKIYCVKNNINVSDLIEGIIENKIKGEVSFN